MHHYEVFLFKNINFNCFYTVKQETSMCVCQHSWTHQTHMLALNQNLCISGVCGVSVYVQSSSQPSAPVCISSAQRRPESSGFQQILLSELTVHSADKESQQMPNTTNTCKNKSDSRSFCNNQLYLHVRGGVAKFRLKQEIFLSFWYSDDEDKLLMCCSARPFSSSTSWWWLWHQGQS